MMRWLSIVVLPVSLLIGGCGGVVDEEAPEPSDATVVQQVTGCMSFCFSQCPPGNLGCRNDCRNNCSYCEYEACQQACSGAGQGCTECVDSCMGW